MSLKDPSQKPVREEEPWEPECLRVAVDEPLCDERYPLSQINEPGPQALQRGVGHFSPVGRYLVAQET